MLLEEVLTDIYRGIAHWTLPHQNILRKDQFPSIRNSFRLFRKLKYFYTAWALKDREGRRHRWGPAAEGRIGTSPTKLQLWKKDKSLQEFGSGVQESSVLSDVF